MQKFATEGPSDRELQKAKNQLSAAFYRGLETISGKALSLGRSDVYFGDAKAFLHTAEMFDKVTAADVQRVARSYFVPRNRTVSVLIPEETQKAQTPTTPASQPMGGQ